MLVDCEQLCNKEGPPGTRSFAEHANRARLLTWDALIWPPDGFYFVADEICFFIGGPPVVFTCLSHACMHSGMHTPTHTLYMQVAKA